MQYYYLSLMLNLGAGLCIFCSTFLKVTLTGGYPALCPVELGLSSKEIVFLPRLPDLLIKYSFFNFKIPF